MPVILKQQDEEAWITKTDDPIPLLRLLTPYPAHEMEAYRVSKAVNDPRNNTPVFLLSMLPARPRSPERPGAGGVLSSVGRDARPHL
jgi:SOS response associated peptidase (SRAP)